MNLISKRLVGGYLYLRDCDTKLEEIKVKNVNCEDIMKVEGRICIHIGMSLMPQERH